VVQRELAGALEFIDKVVAQKVNARGEPKARVGGQPLLECLVDFFVRLLVKVVYDGVLRLWLRPVAHFTEHVVDALDAHANVVLDEPRAFFALNLPELAVVLFVDRLVYVGGVEVVLYALQFFGDSLDRVNQI